MNTLLVVDDENAVRYSFERIFEDEYRVMTAGSGETALSILDSGETIDVIFLDIKMPGMSGIETLTRIKEKNRNIPVVIMTAFGDSDTAITAMREGAFDYLTKPHENEELREIVMKALASSRLQRETFCGISECPLCKTEGIDAIIGKSRAIFEVCKEIGQVAGMDIPVLITGESGVGKELVARAVYNYSKRKGRPFIAVNCAALPEGLVESELFGSERGAFTGAEKRRIGRFEQCNGGTIFLDEIGDMNISTQAKLLRIIQHGTFERLGSNETISSDVRLIAASNKNLSDEVRKGGFREDLYHRLNVFSIHVKPLRERMEDIPLLSEYFISKIVKETGKVIRGIEPRAIEILMSYNWPGNVRELENVIRRAVVVARGEVIGVSDLILTTETPVEKYQKLSDIIDSIFRELASKDDSGVYHPIISSVEQRLIERALQTTGGNQTEAARLLGVTRVTLKKKMTDYKISA